MQTKIASALAVLLCVCTVVNSAPYKAYTSVACEKTVIDGITDEECDDGTGVSSEPGQPDNIILGYDSKGRRVGRVGDEDTCYIYPNSSISLPDKVQKMSIEETLYAAKVTDPEVLASVKEWCGDDVLLLQEDKAAAAGGRHKRSLCFYRYRCIWYRYFFRVKYFCRFYYYCY